MPNKKIVFKAAVLEEFNKPLKIKTIVFNGPLMKGQVLVKLLYSGICGKQIEEIQNKGKPDPFVPHLLGHEGVAIVKEIGPSISKVKKNDKVILHWIKSNGLSSQTPTYKDLRGQKINAGWVTTFNEYAVVSENRLTKINYSKDLQYLSFLGCAIPTAFGSVNNIGKINKNDRVLVIGSGGVGLFILQALQLKKTSLIATVDKSEKALKIAKKIGIKNIFKSNTNLNKELQNITKNRGFTKIFIATNNVSVIKNSFNYASEVSRIILVGVPEYGKKIELNPFDIMHGKEICGTIGGNIKPNTDLPKLIKLISKNKIQIRPVVSKIINFNKINDGIKMMKNHSGGRVVVKF